MVPPAHLFLLPVSFTPCCCKHIKEEWILVVSVQPGHQPKDDNYTQVISSPFQHFVSAFEWTVNRCSVIVMLSGLANKGRILNLALEAKLKFPGNCSVPPQLKYLTNWSKFQPTSSWGPEGILDTISLNFSWTWLSEFIHSVSVLDELVLTFLLGFPFCLKINIKVLFA